MLSRRVCGFLLFILLALFALCGCSTKIKPVVWVDQETTFADYKSLVVRPVMNATGQFVEQQILDVLTDQATNRLEAKGLSIVDPSEAESDTLFVQNELQVYEAKNPVGMIRSVGPEGWGVARCTLRARLFDRARNRAVADIVAVQTMATGGVRTVPFGGASYVNPMTEREILKEVAIAVAEEIARLMKNPSK